MKKVFSIALAVVLVVGLSITAWAAKAETVTEVQHKDTLEVYANHDYTITLGESGDGKEVLEVTTPNNVHSVKTQDAKEDAPATVSFVIGEVLTTGAKTEQMAITIKENNKRQRIYIYLEINPQYVELGTDSWVLVENNIAYSTPETGETCYDFDFGEIIVQNVGQRRVNLTYDNTITEELFNKYGDALVGVADFKGDAVFTRVAKINFAKTHNDEPIYVYEVVDGKLVAIEETKDNYSRNIVRPGSYVFLSEEWVELPVPAPMPEVEAEKPIEVEPETPQEKPETGDLTNVNENPGMGR